MIIRPSEVNYAIEKLPVHKACGPDLLLAEQLKYASQIFFSVTCFVSYRIFTTWCVTSIYVDSFISGSN